MWQRFKASVLARYTIEASLPPSEDYPPANIASMIKQCEALGRSDLAGQIHMQWGKVLKKYPGARVNWGAAVKIGGASIKKNIFGGEEFAIWLKDQEDITPQQKKEAAAVPAILAPAKGTPPIAVPKDNETPDMWREQAMKTKEQLVAARQGFADVKEYIQYLESEVISFQKKIKTYGPGGEKSKTSGGKPSKLSERVPKWQALMAATAEQLAETKSVLKDAEGSFKTAVNDYNHAPLTTVAYEKKVQGNLENILEYVLNLKDLKKQRELLEKLNETMDRQKVSAGVEEVTAAGDRFASFFAKIKLGLQNFKKWLLGLGRSVNSFGKLASMRY